ncbi:hypothetical protein RHSIM_Rhsim11G0067600 [Rhododendron simsii]|uniref:Uncharacterized protein n=1 Tax=Rhododendron simsii TaxID=118357 RepID=A0A834LAC7_RHOSS|nr:hypothetical protein RHSIM_Rhsim11G0067600 [Rhododendron simsii]
MALNLVHQEDVDAIEVQRPKLLLLVHLESLKHHSYTRWIFHGEFVASPVARTEDKGQSDSYEGDEMHELLYDAFGIPPFVPPTDDTIGSSGNYGPDEKTKKFFSLLKEAERELYPGCSKFSTLSFIVRLLHIKTLSGWTDKSFTMLLELLKEAFPEGDTLPKSFYATRVLLKDLGLDYHKGDVNWVRQGLSGEIVDEATIDAELDADMES